MESITELKAQIQGVQEIITKSTQERERLESAHTHARQDHQKAQDELTQCQEAHFHAALQAPGSKEEAAAHGRLRAAKDQLVVVCDRLQVLETGMAKHKANSVEQHQGEIVHLEYRIWQAIMEKEFASIDSSALATMKRAFAASFLGAGFNSSFREFIAQRLAYQAPNPDEIRQIQDQLRAKYKV